MINKVSDNDPVKGKMLELFDAMPEPLQLKWDSPDLAANWLTIMQSSDHPQRKQVVDTIQAHYQSLKKRWSDHDQQLKDRLDWTLFFRENYRKIVALAKAK